MTVRRAGDGRYRGKLVPIDVPAEGTRRERVTATMTRLARRVRGAHRRRARPVVGGLLPDLAGPRGEAARGARRPRGAAGAHDRRRRPAASAAPTCTSTRSPRDGTAGVDGDPRPRRARGPTSTSSPSPTTSGSMPPLAGPGDGASTAGLRVEVVVGEEVTTLGGHLLGAVPRPRRSGPTARSARRSLAVHDAGRPRHPGPSARPVPAVRPGLGAPAAPRRPGPARPPRRARDVQPDDASAGRGTAASSASPTSTASPTSATATPTRSRRSAPAGRPSRAATADDLRRGDRGAARPSTAGRSTAPPASSATFGQPAAQARPRRARRGRAAGSAATAPAATTATPAAASGRRATSRAGRADERGAPR